MTCDPIVEQEAESSARPPGLPEGVPALTTFYLYITNGCNLACRHCWITPKFVNGEPDPGDCLDLELLKKAVNEAEPLGLRGIKLTGGEPTLHPQFREVVAFLTSRGLSLIMETNGTLINAELARFLRKSGLTFVSVSVDGPNSEVHDPFRGVAGSFKQAIRGFHHLVEEGYRPQLIMSVHRGNIEYVEDVINLAVHLGAGSVKLNPVLASGRGIKMSSHGETLNAVEIISLAHKIRRLLQPTTPIRLILSTPPAFYSVAEFVNRKFDGECRVHHILGVLGSGHYALCGIGYTIPELCFGHIQENNLADIWSGTPLLVNLRNALDSRDYSGVCTECIHKANCLTHCVAQNYQDSKQLIAPYWICAEAYEKGIFPYSRLREGAKNAPWRVPDPFGILPIHASAVLTEKGVLAFLGPSETGKSTIRTILKDHFKSIADDAIYLVPDLNNRWDVACADGTAFNGPLDEATAHTLETFPLHAVFRLHQASEPHLEQTNSIEAARIIVNAYFEVGRHRWFDLDQKKRIFGELVAVAQSVPTYHLYFNQTPQTIETVIHTLTSGGN